VAVPSGPAFGVSERVAVAGRRLQRCGIFGRHRAIVVRIAASCRLGG
jgi:hypothetical protein